MPIFKVPFPKLDMPVAAVALGTFDGLHEGHLTVINAAVREAERLGGKSAVWCFSSPPKNVFAPGSAEPLMTPDEKAAAISALGVDIIIMPDPDRSLLSEDADSFISDFLSSLSPRAVFCGYNFTFGKNALGTPERLRAALTEKGISVNIIPPVLGEDGTPVSSSMLRRKMSKKSASE